MKFYTVLELEVPDTDPDIDYRIGMLLDKGGYVFDDVSVIETQEADDALVSLDGPPTLMYP